MRSGRLLSTAQESPERADEELLTLLKEGDEQSFATLVGRYHKRLVRLARSFVHTEASAEEVAQETWLAVLHGLDRFEQRSRFKVWLFRILTNRAKTRAEREARSLPFSCMEFDEGEPLPRELASQFGPNDHWRSPIGEWEQGTPEKLLLSHELRVVLQKGIAQLPPSQRAVLVMRDVEGLEAEEVCRLLELSDANQRVLLHRARTTLRCILDAHQKR